MLEPAEPTRIMHEFHIESSNENTKRIMCVLL